MRGMTAASLVMRVADSLHPGYRTSFVELKGVARGVYVSPAPQRQTAAALEETVAHTMGNVPRRLCTHYAPTRRLY
ncbi:hypothetical protein PUN4_120036 [Paraburkholderia unamae]|nr:hypothetical protein PUN4_120036 [Paraburkholderia unamae]